MCYVAVFAGCGGFKQHKEDIDCGRMLGLAHLLAFGRTWRKRCHLRHSSDRSGAVSRLR